MTLKVFTIFGWNLSVSLLRTKKATDYAVASAIKAARIDHKLINPNAVANMYSVPKKQAKRVCEAFREPDVR